MASAHPAAQANSLSSPIAAPLILLPRSLSPSRQSAVPKPILGANKPSDLATSHISSLQHTLRPGHHHHHNDSLSLHDTQVTLRGSQHHPHYLSSYQRVLARLGVQYSLDAASASTVKPASPSGPHMARLRVDEMEYEVCFRCGAHRQHEDIEMIELDEWGLQWVCKHGCPEQVGEAHEEKERKGDQHQDQNHLQRAIEPKDGAVTPVGPHSPLWMPIS